jgi:hypothetical protein
MLETVAAGQCDVGIANWAPDGEETRPAVGYFLGQPLAASGNVSARASPARQAKGSTAPPVAVIEKRKTSSPTSTWNTP